MASFEEEYYLLYFSDLETYPLICEDCKRLTCSYEQYKKCEKVPDCPAYYQKTEKVENPAPFAMEFITTFTKNKIAYADCYIPLSLSRSSFVISQKLYKILLPLNIEGIQFIPTILYDNDIAIYNDFMYVHTYNFLSVLSVKNSRYQEINGRKISNNLLQIKFNTRRMNTIPLENRLIFRFPLNRNYFFFHTSVAKKIMSENPVGFQFIKVSDLNFPNTNKMFI